MDAYVSLDALYRKYRAAFSHSRAKSFHFQSLIILLLDFIWQRIQRLVISRPMYAHNETKVWTSFSKRIQAISNTSINSSRWFRSNCILSRVPKYRVLLSLHYLQALEISMDD